MKRPIYGLKGPPGSAHSARSRAHREGSEFHTWHHVTSCSADAPVMTSENLEFTSDRLFLFTGQKLQESMSSNGRNGS